MPPRKFLENDGAQHEAERRAADTYLTDQESARYRRRDLARIPTRNFLTTYGARRDAERRAAEAYRRHTATQRLRHWTRDEAQLLDLSFSILLQDLELYDALRPALELIFSRDERHRNGH